MMHGIGCKRLYLAHEFGSGGLWKILPEESLIK
jgi:hypothetical protein